ncbi:DUF6286 domain-containing protein [Nonomuraea recticatena]|uniref:DUF6286 domain-containing protein n=1 Tax=Nonomuraea recticatena TaxID=46178 RepID=A0ABN3RZ42_9ACTN
MTLEAKPEPQTTPQQQTAPETAPVAPVDPAADKAALRAFKPRRMVAASVAALVLIGIGFVAAVEIISTLVNRPVGWLPKAPALSWASATPWSSPQVLAAASVLVLVGLGLLALAMKAGRPHLVPVRTGDPDLIIGLQPKGFAAALARAAEDVPGVHSAKAGVGGGRVAVTAYASGWNDARLTEAVRHAVLARLGALGPINHYRVSVTMKERR